MERERKQKLIVRWSLVTAGLTALFWAVWYLIAGEVPVVTGIKMTENWTYVLPFGISRWWDVLVGPVGSTSIILLLTRKPDEEDKDLGDGLVFGLVTGLSAILIVVVGVAIVSGSSPELVTGLIAILSGTIFFGMALGVLFGIREGLAFGLRVVLRIALGAALGFALGAVIVFGVAVGLAFGLIILIIIAPLKLFYLAIFNSRFWNWLMATK